MHQISRSLRSPRDGWLHRADARVKLVVALAMVILTSLAPADWAPLWRGWPLTWVHVGSAGLAAMALALAGASFRYVITRLALFMAPLALFFMAIPIAQGWEQGSRILAGVLVRSAASWLWMLLLVSTTETHDILRALGRIGMPRVFVATLVAMHQYLWVLADEVGRMQRARQARTFSARRRFSWQEWRAAARLIGVLFLRSTERAERLHSAMVARGFQGEIRFLDDVKK